jgi:hypothetical protein
MRNQNIPVNQSGNYKQIKRFQLSYHLTLDGADKRDRTRELVKIIALIMSAGTAMLQASNMAYKKRRHERRTVLTKWSRQSALRSSTSMLISEGGSMDFSLAPLMVANTWWTLSQL